MSFLVAAVFLPHKCNFSTTIFSAIGMCNSRVNEKKPKFWEVLNSKLRFSVDRLIRSSTKKDR